MELINYNKDDTIYYNENKSDTLNTTIKTNRRYLSN